MSQTRKITKRIIFTVGLILSVSYFLPFVLVFINAFNGKYEILADPLSWPKVATWDTFQQAME